jgi:hypothetical protein
MTIRNPMRRRWLARSSALVVSATLAGNLRAAADDDEPDGNDTPENYSDAPRLALIVGNGTYPASPLTNPSHDAKAMAHQLGEMGFETVLLIDATKAQMIAAIAAFCARLRQHRAVGLFYYAGHGAQQSWRNYLIPVDANVGEPQQLASAALDLGTLLDGLAEAQNPMNILILDACRDDPFGATLRLPTKGLSQFDAPPGTLLAYATAPGRTASDGEGANGLYTGNLLVEMRDPKLKIEDVFKRVRLAVRRRSNGSQIPWESTSLEGDFYLLPKGAPPKLSEQQRKVKFEEGLTEWNVTKVSTDPDVVEKFLRRDPSGPYSESAQVTLNLLLSKRGEERVLPVSDLDNPYSKGTSVQDLHFAVGDSYEYQVFDTLTNVRTGQQTWSITSVSNSQVEYNGGQRVTDLLNNDGNFSIEMMKIMSLQQLYPAQYFVGQRWQTAFAIHVPAGPHFDEHDDRVELNVRIVGREKVLVPAGEFWAFKIVGTGFIAVNGQRYKTVSWVAPDVCRRPIITLTNVRGPRKGLKVKERVELVRFSEKTPIPVRIQDRDLSAMGANLAPHLAHQDSLARA